MRRLDRVVVLGQPRFPLRGLAAEEAVEILEAVAVRPAVLGADRGRLDRRRVVPLAEGGGVVAVVLQHLGDGRGVHRDDAGIAVEGDRALGDGARADARVVAPGQQRGAGRRADRGGVELVVGDAFLRKPVEGRRVDLAAEGLARRRSRHRRAARSGCSARPRAGACGSSGQIIVESCSRGAATPAMGCGGNGRTEPSSGMDCARAGSSEKPGGHCERKQKVPHHFPSVPPGSASLKKPLPA